MKNQTLFPNCTPREGRQLTISVGDMIRAFIEHSDHDSKAKDTHNFSAVNFNLNAKEPSTKESPYDQISYHPVHGNINVPQMNRPYSKAPFASGRCDLPFRIGRYQIVSYVGKGGQATVYRAWDPLLHRDVIIKRGDVPANTGEVEFSRIAQEGAFLAQLEHPGIVRIHDSCADREYPYLVLELIHGQTLQERFRNHRPGARQIRDILVQICDAVSAAHQRGILHLDLKPNNVLITPQGHCKLIDFGLSWLVTKKEGPSLVFLAGTEEYMSPEQRLGATETWTFATDVYGLGAILNFLLTGSPPDQRVSPKQDGSGLTQGLFGQWPFVPTLSGIRRRALCMDIHDRFENVEQFRAALLRTPLCVF